MRKAIFEGVLDTRMAEFNKTGNGLWADWGSRCGAGRLRSSFLKSIIKISNIDFVLSTDLEPAGPAGSNGAVRCTPR